MTTKAFHLVSWTDVNNGLSQNECGKRAFQLVCVRPIPSPTGTIPFLIEGEYRREYESFVQ